MVDWKVDPDVPARREGRIVRTFGEDIESVLFAVLTFLSGGIILFIGCFIITKIFQCYKARMRKKRRRALGEEDDEDEFDEAMRSGAFDTQETCVEEQGRLVDL